jgi:type I restriction enzyme R subunit
MSPAPAIHRSRSLPIRGKRGIRDGFLAPYTFINVRIDREVQGNDRNSSNSTVANEVEVRFSNAKDFGSVLIARKITEFLKDSGDCSLKTIRELAATE